MTQITRITFFNRARRLGAHEQMDVHQDPKRYLPAAELYFRTMQAWMWLAAGVALLVIELATPSGFVVMFFGLGALTVGALTVLGLIGQSWLQWLVFTVASVTFLAVFRGRFQNRVDQPRIDVDSLIGEIAVPKERIAAGDVGRIELRGTLWNARNNAAVSIEVGQRCRVTGVDAGLLVFVQPE